MINMRYNLEYMITKKYQKAYGQLRQHYKNKKKYLNPVSISAVYNNQKF